MRLPAEISRRTQLELQALFCWGLYEACFVRPNGADVELARDASPLPAVTDAAYVDAGDGFPGWRACLDLLRRRR